MRILSKIFDRVAAPAPIVDKLGMDAFAKNRFERTLSRPDFLVPLGIATSYLAISAATGPSTHFIVQAVDGAFGILLHQMTEPLFERSRWRAGKTTYYLDRTKRALLQTPSDAILRDLRKSRATGKQGLAIDSGIACSVWAIETALTGSPSLFTLTLFSAPVTRSFAAYHRANKALSGAWRIHEDLPAQEQKSESRSPVGRTAPAP